MSLRLHEKSNVVNSSEVWADLHRSSFTCVFRKVRKIFRMKSLEWMDFNWIKVYLSIRWGFTYYTLSFISKSPTTGQFRGFC